MKWLTSTSRVVKSSRYFGNTQDSSDTYMMKEHKSLVSNDDWRLTGKKKYLLGNTLYWRQHKAYSETWKHDHCAFCWDTFEGGKSPDSLHEGYTTDDNYYWVCRTCFDDFKDMFQWKVGC